MGHWALLALGGLVVLVGIATLTQATMGVGIVAIGCFLGISARLVQAAAYQRDTLDLLRESVDLLRGLSEEEPAEMSRAGRHRR